MYAAYFGLEEIPFNLSPEPGYLYLSGQHRDALNYLIYGIAEKKGFMLIAGDVGTGKTTICRSLLAVLDGLVETALIFNTAVSEMELLETICREFGVSVTAEPRTKKTYLDALNTFLLANFAKGRSAVLLIDEAQNLTHGVLEQIRMLSNLETEKEKLLHIVLVGQPELKATLALPSLRQLNERITVRYDLRPLAAGEIDRYIAHRLRVAGGPGKVKFTQGAYHQVYYYSEGIPRRINALCDRALLIAYTKNKTNIDRRMIRKAVRDIGTDYFQTTVSTARKLWMRLTA
ncbi:MAG: AAA family ATPase [Smithellaceae bacterium]